MNSIDRIISRQRNRLEVARLEREGKRTLVRALVVLALAVGIILALAMGTKAYVERHATAIEFEQSIYTEEDRIRIARLFSQIDKW